MEKLTNSQESIWVTEQYYKGSSINTICGTAIIEEKVDFKKLKKAMEIVYEKHDSYKLRVKIENGEVQQVLSNDKIKIDTINISNTKELEKERKKIISKPFKVENSELFKFYIIKFENGEGGFILDVHHLISDAWTLALSCNEIIKTYSDLQQNKEIETKAIYSYIDYIKSEQEYIKSEKFQKDKQYWKEKFKEIPEVATIPGSKENPDEKNPTAKRKQFELKVEFVEKLKQYCKENKISLYNFFMAIYAIYIGEISNLDEFVIGTPILNRTNFKEKSATGMFVNIAPFKINIKQEIEFKTFVKNIAVDSLNMLKHQKYSYQYFLEDLRKENRTIPNLYNILLSYQITNTQMSGGEVKYKTEWNFNGYCADNIDIQIFDINDTGNLSISYDYKTSIYEEKDIENLHKRILNIITQIISKENLEIKDIEIVTSEEEKKLLQEFNKTELQYDKTKPIIKYFEEQVEKTPNRTAIVFKNKKMSYKEINEKANSLAYELRKNGVRNNTIIGILEERSFEMMIAILAVLKSGGAYIPIAPDYPNERIEYMLSDSNAKILLTSKKIKTDKKIIDIKLKNKIYENNKQNLKNISKSEDLSYLIYTSGSTGKPKGVMLKQQNLSNFYNSMKEKIEYLKDEKHHNILSITTVAFDIFGFETLMSLTKGLTIYMTNENEQKMSSELERIIKTNQIEIMQTTPSIMKFHLENIGNSQNLQSLKYIMLAGEPLPKILVEKIKNTIKDVKIYNGYGPSETTIFSTIANVTNQDKITIGKPIHNTQIYILNKNQKLIPQGTIGEIYISGDGVGKGYINKEQQTKENFISNKFRPGTIMYKVGDLGTFDEKGEITCYGRIDNQVKIRGLRIELSEIEKQILSIYNVSDCIVVKKEIQGKDALCAYYTQKVPIDINVVKNVLQEKLPQYMLPQYFIKLEQMPHTPNGKIDRKALPLPDGHEIKREIIKPKNEIDKQLLQIIKKMLNEEKVSLSDTLLDLGGDSLTAITLCTKISSKFDVQINIKDIMSNKTLQEVSEIIRDKQAKGYSKIQIEKVEEQEYYPLSSAQNRIYYNAKMIDEQNIVYNMPGGILIDEILDIEKIRKVFNEIIRRHSTLRTSFILKNNEVMQQIHKEIEINIPTYQNTQKEIDKILNDFSKPFNLEQAPLIRAEVHYIDNKKTLLLLDAHHIIMDGTSLNNLIIEFNRLYNGEELKNIPIQYTDYSVWENKYNESKNIKKNQNYWINKFKDSDFAQLNLPYDYKITTERKYTGNKIANVIDEIYFRKIEKYAKKIGVSPYMLFITAFIILLYKYTGQNDINIGSPIINRDINETKRMIGMFVNNIVVRGKINPEETFQEFVEEIKNQILDDISYQPYPFDKLIKDLGMRLDSSRNPLFDVMFTYQNKEENIIKIGDKEQQIIEINTKTSKFNLSLEVKPKTHTINIEYCTELFKKETIENLFKHYMVVIGQIVNDNNVKIKDIEIISEIEKNKILNKFNDTKLKYDETKTVLEMFEEQAQKTPETIAIIFEDNKITYKELDEKSNRLAHYLREKNIDKNEIVSIKLNRSIELIISIIAVLKSGASYILIDPSLPEDRIKYMIENAKSKMLINETSLNKIKLEDYSKEKLKNVEKTEDLCILYTSGSTGTPKGVLLTKKGFTNLMHAFDKDMGTSKYKTILGIATVAFDMFAVELYTALTFGNTLILANEEEQKDVVAMSRLMKKYNVEFFVTTPSRAELLMLEECENPLENVKCFQLGGEKFTQALYEKLIKYTKAKIYNGYGPTEISACCSNKLVKDNEITIGKPIGNVQIGIYSKDMNLCPIGIVGEICVSGYGVSKGYINNEEKNKSTFVRNKKNQEQIMYKTGDLGKFLENGEIEYIGREDTQIKIRGLRIELSEIEAKLNEIEEINQSAVIYVKDVKAPYLLSFVTSNDNINVHNIKEILVKSLPKYMVPRYIIQLDNMPVTLNGKIDKRKLEKYVISQKDLLQENTYVAPENEKQKLFCDIWSSLLGIEVGLDDDLFDIGADSLLAIKFKTQLLAHKINIQYAHIFKYKTIRRLCEVHEKDGNKIEELSQYDYSKINGLLENQSIKNKETKTDNNVLLLGATGFVGIHILYELIKNTTGKIYCIIREKNNKSARERFEELLHFYFKEELDKYLDNRIFIIKGNVLKEHFALSDSNYNMLTQDIDVVINSVANVKHYGGTEKFKNINIGSIQILIDFCLQNNKRLMHISSLSISGNTILDGTVSTGDNMLEKNFSEKDLYIGQTLDNVYSRSKFEGERLILENIIKNHLNAQILRLGNITSRYKDGKFQINCEENAFANRIKSFIKLKVIPDSLLKDYVEFTPVDLCAESITNVLNNRYPEMYIYHIYNDKHIYFSKLIKLLQILNVNIKILEEKEFKEKINSVLNDNNKNESLSGIINDFDNNQKLSYSSNIKISNKITKEILKRDGFEWKEIDENYLKKYLDYLKKIKFID